jgi:PKD repeat protein
MRNLFITTVLLALSLGTFAQTQKWQSPQDAKNSAELQLILKNNEEISKRLVAEKAKTINYPVRQVEANGRIIEFVGLSETGMPIYNETTNNIDAARTISTNKVWPGGGSGLNLTGQGMTNRIGIWDGGAVRVSHQEFQGRAVQTDGASSLSDHATHVAGTMVAGGVNANAKGMSYQAPIKCHDWNSDVSEMASAAAAGLLVSNHSYSQISGWNYNSSLNRWENWADPDVNAQEDYKFGYYDNICQTWDQLANTYPNYTMFVAAGNDRGTPSPYPSTFAVRNGSGGWVNMSSSDPNKPSVTGPYDCISGGQANAKNTITIGAVNKITTGYSNASQVVMSSFSGWGPTDDGRIKPDLVANGVAVFSAYSSSNTAYSSINGTSMATPNASGSALLVQQHYNNLRGSFMRSSTLKGLLIHTADEAGTSAGPDYTFGWGLMNTDKATKVIADTLKNKILQLSLANNGTYTYSLYTDGTAPLRASICWTDVAATPFSPALDNTTKRLVNDLDIRVRRSVDNVTFNPYVLNPASPASAAATGDNNTDNVELIHIATPTPGVYTITISHKGTLSAGSQNYALVISGITPKPTAAFTVNTRTVCTNQNVSFTNQSVGASSIMWYFPGGTPATTSANNPMVSYAVPGYYPVALRISSPNGFDSLYFTDYINVGGISLPLEETFEANSPTRSLWRIENLNNDSTWRLVTVGGTTPGNTALGINNYDVTTEFYYDRLVSPVLDLRGLSTATLQFQHAYTRYDNTASDSLIVAISTNCGQTYTRLGAYGENGSGNFATAPDNTFASVNAFIPNKAEDWCGGAVGAPCYSYDLTPYIGNPNVRIRFEQISNFGANNMYLDNIKITGTSLAPKAGLYTLTPTVCVGDEVQLLDSSANNPQEWKWMVSDADTMMYTIRSPHVKFTSAGAKTISLTVKNAAGADSITRVGYINVLPSPTPPSLTSTKGAAICDGDSTVLSTDATSSFVWFRNQQNMNLLQTSFTTKDEALYFVRLRGANGCWAKSVELNLQAGTTPAKPTVTKDLTGTQFCEGGSFNLTSSALSGNQWYVNDTAITGALGRVLNYGNAGNFKVVVSDKGCTNTSDALSISMLPRPNTSAISGMNYAVKGDTARFSVVAGMTGSVFNWTLSGGSIESGSATPSVLIRFGNGSLATVNVQENASNGCKGVQQSLAVNLVTTGITQVTKNELKLYPNPATSMVTLQLTGLAANTPIEVALYNVLGQAVIQEQARYNGQHYELNLQDLNPGVYIVKLQAGGKVYTKNFVKE